MVKPGVYTVDKKQLKDGEKITEYVHVEVQPLPPKPSETANRKGCNWMRLLGVFLFLLVLVGIAIGLVFAFGYEDHHPENNGDDCPNCYGGWTPEVPPGGDPHHGEDPVPPEDRPDRPPNDHDDDGGHHGRPGDDDDDDGGHHGGPGHHDDDDDDGGHHGGPGHHDGGHHGGHDGRPEDHDGHGDNDGRPDHPDEQMPPIDYVGTRPPLLGRPDGHDGFHGDDSEETEDGADVHGRGIRI